MKINHNDSAVITNVKLLRNEGFLTQSMERLSSGFRLNHAKDDPSGMAISNKMQAQIRGLSQASRNSSDGLSVLETADGTLQELTNILQRVRELSVQAANDSNCDEDRDSIQLEIDELMSEVDRIAEASEFNTKSILDGSLDTHSYGDFMTRRHISESVQEGFYFMKVEEMATRARVDINIGYAYPIEEEQAGEIKINDAIVNITAGMTEQDVKAALKNGCERGGCEAIFDGNGKLEAIESIDYGKDAEIRISADAVSAPLLGIAPEVENNLVDGKNPGKDAVINIKDATDPNPDPAKAQPNAFSDHPNATIKQRDNKITITDTNGFEISFKLDEKFTAGETLSLEVTDIGPMDIQVGANAYQQIPVRIPSVAVKDLYLDNINVRTHTTASKAIKACDEAISYVNNARSRIGAYSNRLEHTVLSTDNTEENMTAALSRIKDVDMAEEMSEYTKQNVLVQAATSALSQANEIPQMALQLIQ